MDHLNQSLLWGYKDGKMHFIEDIENGLACDCVCPYCSQPLIARNNGQIRSHSFAHVSGTECSKSIESAVHKLAKQVFVKTKKLLPATLTRHAPIKPSPF
jgi:competence CoiA-like predicted nuclease